jgi:hypothetical protein
VGDDGVPGARAGIEADADHRRLPAILRRRVANQKQAAVHLKNLAFGSIGTRSHSVASWKKWIILLSFSEYILEYNSRIFRGSITDAERRVV